MTGVASALLVRSKALSTSTRLTSSIVDTLNPISILKDPKISQLRDKALETAALSRTMLWKSEALVSREILIDAAPCLRILNGLWQRPLFASHLNIWFSESSSMLNSSSGSSLLVPMPRKSQMKKLTTLRHSPPSRSYLTLLQAPSARKPKRQPPPSFSMRYLIATKILQTWMNVRRKWMRKQLQQEISLDRSASRDWVGLTAKWREAKRMLSSRNFSMVWSRTSSTNTMAPWTLLHALRESPGLFTRRPYLQEQLTSSSSKTSTETTNTLRLKSVETTVAPSLLVTDPFTSTPLLVAHSRAQLPLLRR